MAFERRSQYRSYTDRFVGIDFFQQVQPLTQKTTHDNRDIGHPGRADDRVQPCPGARHFNDFHPAAFQHGTDRHHAFRGGNFLLLNQEVYIVSHLIDEYLLDAVAVVSAWDDVPDEEFAGTVNAQARLIAGINPDEVWRSDDHSPFHTQ